MRVWKERRKNSPYYQVIAEHGKGARAPVIIADYVSRTDADVIVEAFTSQSYKYPVWDDIIEWNTNHE